MRRILAIQPKPEKRMLFLILLVLYSIGNANAAIRIWNGAGISGGTGGTDMSSSFNWSGGTPLLPSDDYQVNVGTIDGAFTLTTSSALSMNSLSVTLAASGNTLRQIIINISQNLAVTGSIAIINATTSGNVNHEIDFNIAGGTTNCGSFITNANGTGNGNVSISNAGVVSYAGGFPQIKINIASGAILECLGDWTSDANNSSNTTTTISDSGILTVSGNTTISSPRATGSSQLRPIYLMIDNDPAVAMFNGSVSLGASVAGYVTSSNGSHSFALNATGYGGVANTSTGSITLKKDVTLGPSSVTTNYNNFTLLFDGTDTQTAIDNTGSLRNIVGNLQVGNDNNPIVNIEFNNGNAGYGMFDVYNNLSVNGTSILSIGQSETLNNYNNNVGTFTLAAAAMLKLEGTTSGNMPAYGPDIGSNFPKRYSSYALNANSTVEYNAAGSQTIYDTPTYSNLTVGDVTNTPATIATLAKALSVPGNLLINPNATLDVSSNNWTLNPKANWTNNGTFIPRNGNVSFNDTAMGNTSAFSGNTTFYDLILTNDNGTTDLGSSTETITHSFSTSGGTMNGNTSTFIFTGDVSIIGANAKNFYNLQITGGSNVTHLTGGGNIHVANSFINDGTLTENTGYSFYFDKSGATETMSGNGTSTFGKLVVGDGSGFSLAMTLNCSSDFTIAGGSISFNKNSNFNGSNNKVTFSTNSCAISGTGTANFYNVSNNVSLNFGSGISKINNNLTINTAGFVITNPPFYSSSATLVYNTTNSTFNTGAEWTGNTGSTGLGEPYNVIIQNANNIILSGSRIVPGTLTIEAANSLDINGSTLTVNTNFSGTGKLKGSQTSGLTTSGSGTVYFDDAANFLRTLTVNTTGNLTLGDALSIAAGSIFGTVTVNGTLNSNDYLTLKSDANGTARVAPSTGVITGNVTVERYMPPLRAWRFLTVPFASTTQTINDAWQEGKVNPDLDCSHNQYVQTGYGTEITYNATNGYDPNTTANPSIKVWNGYNWITLGSTYIPINTYSAYCLFVRGDRTICLNNGVSAGSNTTILRATGVLNEAGVSANSITKSYVGTAGDYIFIGNPYASSVDLSAVLSTKRSGTSGVDNNKFWVWDPKLAGNNGVGGYVAYSDGIQVPGNNSSTYTAGTIIQSGQAFMVHTNRGNASVNFQQSDKVASEVNVFGKQSNPAYTVIYANLMAVSEDNLTLTDGVAAVFDKQFSAAVDENDAAKLWNFTENIALVRNSGTLAIEFRPISVLTDTLFYRLYLAQKPYSLQIFSTNLPENIRMQALLIDKYLNTKTKINLSDTTLYSFTPNSDTDSYRNRFMLVLSRQYSGTPVSIRRAVNQARLNTPGIANIIGDTTLDKISLYPNPTVENEKVMLNFTRIHKGSYMVVVVTDKGQMLERKKIEHAGGNNIYPLSLNSSWAAGVYTIKITDCDSKKIFTLRLVIK
jgi:hypothetical protein